MTRFAKRLLLSLALFGVVLAASAEIRWIEKDFDFGLMKESGGKKTGHSSFINLGPDTICIMYVRPSCGCTTASFTDGFIAPGDTAGVSYTYDPEMRPGRFDKTVKVKLSDGSNQVIRITGNVLGTPQSLQTVYPVDAGDMRLSQSSVVAREVTMGHVPMYFINAYSLPLDTIVPALNSPEKALTVEPNLTKAGPGDIVTFQMRFDSQKYGQYGPVEIPMEFIANTADETSQRVTVPFKAFVIPDKTRLLTMQCGKNPICNLAPDPLNLGAEIGDRVVETEIEVTNNGTGPLHILRICSNIADVKAPKIPSEIKPGKTAKVKIRIDASTLPEGTFRVPLYVITDDPDHPTLSLALTGSR